MRYYGSQVKYVAGGRQLDLVPGLVNMKRDTLHAEPLNSDFTALYSHDHQAEDGSMLAMALLCPRELVRDWGTTPDEGPGITQTDFIRLRAQPEHWTSFRFYARWEGEDPRWTSPEEVRAHLTREADLWTRPPVVHIRRVLDSEE
ncbi:MAG: DUF4861 family protein [Bacteroidales bacterium]